MRIDDLNSWEAFLGVAQQGNFTKASKVLRVPTPQLSKRVSKLESQLGVRLFQRSTRVVTLTDEGRSLVPRVRAVFEDLKGIENSFESERELSGVIRVTAVPYVANRLLPAVLKRFAKDHPKVQVHLELTKRFTNIIEAGMDMAIRIETPKDSDLVYRKIAPNQLVMVASPQYLEGKSIQRPEDLSGKKLLMMGIHGRCRIGGSPYTLDDFQSHRAVICEDGPFLTDLCRQGFGILVRAIWDVEDDLSSGKLVQVLEDYPLETFGYIHAVIPSKRYLAPRVRVFLDCVLEEAKKHFQPA